MELAKYLIFLISLSLTLSITAGQTTENNENSPIPGSGELIWKHDFRDGMPNEFKQEAEYPKSGTWGRSHELDGGEVYEPAKIVDGKTRAKGSLGSLAKSIGLKTGIIEKSKGDIKSKNLIGRATVFIGLKTGIMEESDKKLRVKGPSCSHKGVATPQHLKKDINNWELHYKVEDHPGSTGHSDRMTAGGYFAAEPQGNYNDDRGQFDQFGFEDNTESFVITNGNDSKVSRYTGRNGNFEDATHVRMASSTDKGKTWVKWWPEKDSEPSGWNLTFESASKGRPSFGAHGTCKGSARSNDYYFYELRNISFEQKNLIEKFLAALPI